MTELEMSETLGIILDPENNRLSISKQLRWDIQKVYRAFSEANTQRESFGTLNEDLWLEFIPWHSLN
jgi:hypothetical protein